MRDGDGWENLFLLSSTFHFVIALHAHNSCSTAAVVFVVLFRDAERPE